MKKLLISLSVILLLESCVFTTQIVISEIAHSSDIDQDGNFNYFTLFYLMSEPINNSTYEVVLKKFFDKDFSRVKITKIERGTLDFLLYISKNPKYPNALSSTAVYEDDDPRLIRMACLITDGRIGIMFQQGPGIERVYFLAEEK